MVVMAVLANKHTGKMDTNRVVQAWGHNFRGHLFSAMTIETDGLLFPFRGEVMGQGIRLWRGARHSQGDQ